MNAVYEVTEGESPLLVSIPHGGTYVPQEIASRFTPAAASLPDTDWHVPRLYRFARTMGATVVEATHSRYVIDLNRPTDGTPLYPGKQETTLCPTETFAGEAIYLPGSEPSQEEIAARIRQYWEPYHREIRSRLLKLRERFGFALLWDAHSIRSRVPKFFEGELPNLNLGTADGKSCAPELAEALLTRARASPYSVVLNGRFKGGYITRHYGNPSEGVHAVQLEMTQLLYMNEDPPYTYDDALATRLIETLQSLLGIMIAFRP